MASAVQYACVFFVLELVFCSLAANNSLSPPPVLASGGCIRAGETVSFECVAVDIVGAASTVWRGSAFNCPTSEVTTNNTITLPHGFFLSGAVGTCDSLMARGDSVEGNCYSSTLTVPATSGLDGTTVECSLGGVIDIGSSTLQIGVVPGPPQLNDTACTPRSPLLPDLSSTVSNSTFTISWRAPANGAMVEGSLSYPRNITGDCGVVDNSDPFSAVFSDWQANGQVCTVEVAAMEDPASRCGFTGEAASVEITFEVPVEPTSVGATMTCANMNFLPIQVEWTVAAVATDAPCYLVPVVTYLLCSGPNADATCVQENLLGSSRVNVNETQFAGGLVVGEVYSFSVLQENVIGQGAARSDNITVRRVEIDDSTAADEPPVITVILNRDCSESPGEFTCVFSAADVSTPVRVVFSDNYVAVIPIDADTTTDYTITIEHASDLVSSDSRVTSTATGATAPHGSVVNFACSGAYVLSGPASARCQDGVWTPAVGAAVHSCSLLPGVIAAIVIAILVVTVAACTVVAVIVFIVTKRYNTDPNNGGIDPGPLYAEVGPADQFQVEANTAYGPVRKKAAAEQFEMEGNAAYGPVRR